MVDTVAHFRMRHSSRVSVEATCTARHVCVASRVVKRRGVRRHVRDETEEVGTGHLSSLEEYDQMTRDFGAINFRVICRERDSIQTKCRSDVFSEISQPSNIVIDTFDTPSHYLVLTSIMQSGFEV